MSLSQFQQRQQAFLTRKTSIIVIAAGFIFTFTHSFLPLVFSEKVSGVGDFLRGSLLFLSHEVQELW